MLLSALLLPQLCPQCRVQNVRWLRDSVPCCPERCSAGTGAPSVWQRFSPVTAISLMNRTRSRLLWSVFAVALLAAGPVAAQQPMPRGGILIVEHPRVAESRGEAVRIELVVEGLATSATGARSASELAAQRVVRALATSGVTVQDVQVAGTTLLAEYAVEGPLRTTTIRGAPRPVGYRALTSITLRTAEVQWTGLLLDTARGAGATPLRAVHEAERTPPAQR
jgi:uncharacterized protein YggE